MKSLLFAAATAALVATSASNAALVTAAAQKLVPA